MTSFQKKTWIGLLVMALLSPLGLIVPRKFNAGEAWGEWGADRIGKLLGYVPEGMKRLADIWHAPVAGYNFGGEGSPMSYRIISYVVSGLIGILLAGMLLYLLSRLLLKKRK
jgi:hypothetical protein